MKRFTGTFSPLARSIIAACLLCGSPVTFLGGVDEFWGPKLLSLSAQDSESAGVAPPQPWPEVRARRLTPPKAGSTNRITIQIRPSTPSGPTEPAEPGKPHPQASASSTTTSDLLNWFWDAVPHDTIGAAPERFLVGLAALKHERAKTLSTPNFQDVTNIAKDYGTDLLVNSINTQVSPALALAVIAVESAGKVDANSSAGAQGLMQLIPATAERFGVTDSLDASQNIRGGITYLDWLISEFRGDVVLALAGYNAGENAVRKHNGVPPFAETRAYVPKVLAAWQVAKRLCVTQPELYSDGCVFATNALQPVK